MNGIIIVDKPAGWTSQDVVSKLRGVFGQRRIGHGGTLDPMATGVLSVFVGRATRAVEFFEAAEKEYVAGLRLGLTTDTEDITGTVQTTQPADCTRSALEAVLPRFTGEIQQIPPMYSAVKIGGQKLYKLARQGKEVERQPRRVTIFELEVLDGCGADWTLRIRCSKGTYVRTLCSAIGAALGCGGCMSSLRRTAAGIYTLQDAVTLPQILETPAEARAGLLRGVDTLFADLPAMRATPGQERAIRNGSAYSLAGAADGDYRVYGADGFLCLGRVSHGVMKTVKSFFEVN